MRNNVNNSQSTEARNSAISNIFSKKSVLDFAVYAYNKMAKSSNGNSDNFSVVVGDGYRVTMNCGMDVNECRLVLNIYLEEKCGSRYVRMREYHSGWADMATEYMACSSWKSVVVYAIKDAIESMVSKVLDNYIKDGDEYSIALWESMTGMIYMAPCLEEAPCLEDDYIIEEVCDGFYEIKFLDEDGITEDGYSIMGLNYLSETMVDEDIEDIVDEAYEEVSNDLYVWLNEMFRSGECPKDEFMDTMWAYVWDIIMDKGLSDEALESETRYYVEFDDIVERRLEEWGLYERYDKIYMERAYSNR
jgi:hypothetical protein